MSLMLKGAFPKAFLVHIRPHLVCFFDIKFTSCSHNNIKTLNNFILNPHLDMIRMTSGIAPPTKL